MRILKNLVPALLVATTLGSVAALAAEPSPAQASQGEASSNPVARTTWNCSTVMDGTYRGQVTIWWGHTPGDAQWACNNWISTCGNSHAGCYATPAH